MNDRRERGQVQPDPVGLCRRCARVRIVPTASGSRFYLCRLSSAYPAFPRYPTLPVLECRGFAPDEADPVVR